MWRTVIINHGEKIGVSDSRLVISGEREASIPLEDLFVIVVDNRRTVLTVPAITALTDAGVHVMLCNEKHLPVSVVLPLNTHYQPLDVIERQLALSQQFKDVLWQEIIRAKVDNQVRVLRFVRADATAIRYLERFSSDVKPGDTTNREGLAAKVFFRALFGSDFIRMNDDAINAALNYGYAILRSTVAKTLVAYGYNCVLGVHHVSKSNPFNLADDMMEPLRPCVDFLVDQIHGDLVEELTKENRKELINILNSVVCFDDRRMRMRYAIDKYISSLTTAIRKNNASLLKIPVLVDDYDIDFEDGEAGG